MDNSIQESGYVHNSYGHQMFGWIWNTFFPSWAKLLFVFILFTQGLGTDILIFTLTSVDHFLIGSARKMSTAILGRGYFWGSSFRFFFFFVFGGNPRPGGLRVPSIKATTSSEMNLFRLVLPEIHFILSFWGLKDKNVTPALVRPPNSKRMFTRDPGLLILSPPNCWRYVCTYSNLLLCTTPHTCTGKGSRL